MGKKMPTISRLALNIRVKKLLDVADKNDNIIDKEKNKINLKYAVKQKVLKAHINESFNTKDDMYKFAIVIVEYFIDRGGNPLLILQALH